MVDKEKFAAQEAMGYNLYIVAKNFQLTEPMRKHIWDKLSKIERFHSHIMDVHVTLEIQKVEHVCVLTCHFNHFKVKVEAHSTDMYASIDKAIHKLQNQFRKWKGRIQDYHRAPVNAIDMRVNVYRRPPQDETDEINKEIDAENLKNWIPGKVLSTEVRVVRHITIEQAIMKMELSHDPFMLFRDDADQKLKLIYRREEDTNYGVIETEA